MVKHKGFKLNELFNDIESGKRLKQDDHEEGSLPFVMSGFVNQGISGNIDNDVKIYPANSITVDILGNVFYRNHEYGLSDDVVSLMNDDMSKGVQLYISTALAKEITGRFDYGRKFRKRDTSAISVQLPVNSSGQPDFDYMENYIKEIEQKYIKKLESDLESRTENLLTVIGREDLIGDPDDLAVLVAAGFDNGVVDYAEFRVGDILEVSPTKKLTELGPGYIKDSDIISDDGVTPYIAAVSTNNGISGYSIYEPTNEGGVITVSTTADSSNTLFYQKGPFIGRQQMAQIKHINGDKLNQRVAAYLISLFRRHMSTFNYGTKLRVDNLVETMIVLPVTPQGTPDFDFMENYIAYIELTHTYALMQWMKAKKSA